MSERMAPVDGSVPEAEACFTVILQGSMTWAGVVKGVAGVKETLQRLLCRGCNTMPLDQISDALVSMDDQTAWAVHGTGDGRPYWHWWLGYEGGSVTVQRLTAPLCQNQAAGELHATLREVADILAEYARDLRALGNAEQKAYVLARRQSDQVPK
jgi:hypothetical protein